MSRDRSVRLPSEALDTLTSGLTVVDFKKVGGDAAGLAECGYQLRTLAAQHGAIMVRGLNVWNVEEAARASRQVMRDLLTEREGFAPRDQVEDGLYFSAHWPPDQPMCMHHELSYARTFPGTLALFCLRAPDEGGISGIADASAVLDALPEDLVRRFADEGWLLTRSYNDMVGVPWSDAFGTSDRTVVEKYCRANDIEFEWAGENMLRTWQKSSPLVRHPETGRVCWFNQIAFLNEWTMDPNVRDYLVDEFGKEWIPFNTFYGDGSPIEPELVEMINEVYERHTMREPWRQGDMMILDNIQVAHSRESYLGQRDVLVAMGDPIDARRVAWGIQ